MLDSKHGVVCDFCEKKVYAHVTIGVRRIEYGKPRFKNRGWGFFEGHQRCWPLDRKKLKRPLKARTITRWNYR